MDVWTVHSYGMDEPDLMADNVIDINCVDTLGLHILLKLEVVTTCLCRIVSKTLVPEYMNFVVISLQC